MTCYIRILLPPSPLFHEEKRSVVKSFKLTRKFQQISGFLLNTFFPKYFGGGNCPPPAPPLATALITIPKVPAVLFLNEKLIVTYTNFVLSMVPAFYCCLYACFTQDNFKKCIRPQTFHGVRSIPTYFRNYMQELIISDPVNRFSKCVKVFASAKLQQNL